MNAEQATRIRTNGILKTLRNGMTEGRITQAEYDEHQTLARQLINCIDNEEKAAVLHKRMTEIIDKADQYSEGRKK